jgi:hypothetical protein
VVALGAAPMQCPSDDREPLPTSPEAPEECYLLAQRLLEQGDSAGWRAALEYVVERFPDSRWAARARDDLEHGVAPGRVGLLADVGHAPAALVGQQVARRAVRTVDGHGRFRSRLV